MRTLRRRRAQQARRPAAWPGLLLGSLLALFMAVILYTAFLFVLSGQSVLASLPELPPLPLPKLVRSASAPAAAVNYQPWLAGQPQPVQTPRSEPAQQSRRVTVLIMGVDNRPDEPVARTDSIMLLTVNPQTGATGMLSLARDLLVHVPAVNRDVKINSVHVLGEVNHFPGGGPAMLRDTVSEMVGYPVDYYVRLNFDGFREVVDLIGGVDIDVAKAINDTKFPDENYGYDPLYIPAGRQHMDGNLALKYARTRHGDDDYGRASRQQQVAVAIKDKLTQPGQLAALLPRLPGLALALANSVQTDMPVDKAITLARLLDRSNLKNPTRAVIDRSMGREVADYPTWGFVLIPDMGKVRTAATKVFSDVPSGQSAEETERKQVQAEGARVVVLNGSQEEGLAARTAAILTSAGFKVVAVGNAERVDYAQNWLFTHGDVGPATREALVRRFGISPDRVRSEPPSADADLTLVVGAEQARTPSQP